MLKFLKILTQDPILIITTFVLVAAVVILAWAIAEYFGLSKRNLHGTHRQQEPPGSPGSAYGENPSQPRESDPYVLFEARMNEVSNQLSELGRRLSNIEKGLNQKIARDQTIPAMTNTAEMEKFILRIEKRLELLASDKGQVSGDTLSKLEAKIEGIHKLLIVLTDGSSPEEK
ncbi:MAG: hypothetical protein ABII64_01405 [Elusimicrobiota bacterium]